MTKQDVNTPSTASEVETTVSVDAQLPPARIKLGSLLVAIAQEAGGLTDAEAERFTEHRKIPAKPLVFDS